jgi:pimeloyl-ACP methyl ester carboxylesterase
MDKVCTFGKQSNLIGIYSSADNTEENKSVVLILNAGLVHRPGPFRINTELAQHLNENGYDAFRFDLSGIGDSDKPAQDSRTYEQRNIDDIGEAIQYLEKQQANRKIIVIGLCTGADHAHKAAVKFPQISGAILLDGYGYPTAKFTRDRYLPVLLNPIRLIRALFGKIIEKFSSGNDDEESYYWVLPDRNDYINDLNNLHSRGVKQLYVFSGGVGDYYNYEEQFADGFAGHNFVDDVEVHHVTTTDHTYIILEERAQLFDRISSWLKNAL